MANLMKISGPARALLLLAALLAAGARADRVTTAECKALRRGESYLDCRVRRSPLDTYATWLDMSRCSLTRIPQQQFSGLTAVTTLWLYENELRDLPVFENHVCAKLTRLYLHMNQLTGIYNAMTFSACRKLEELHLYSNRIEDIDISVFTPLIHLRYLQLQDNMIRYIPDRLLASNGELAYLRLDGNRITHLPPEFASRLKRAGAGLYEFFFYNNPWHCACLIELLADVRRAGMYHYHKKTYNGTAPVCVHIDTPRYKCRDIRELSTLLFNKQLPSTDFLNKM